eukprot:gene9065-9817_t
MLKREKLLKGITALTRLEDVSPQSIEGWVNSVNDATRVSQQLSDEGVSHTLTFVNRIVQATQEWSLSDSVSLSSLMDALDSASSALQLNDEMKTRRRKRALSERGTASVVSLQSTLSNFTSLLVSTMVPGESAVTAAKSNMRIYLEAVDASETENGNCSSSREVTLPLTSLESYLGKMATRVIVPTCRTDSNVSNNFQIVTSTLSNGLYNQEYDSDLLSLALSSIPCSSISQSCEVQLVLGRDLGSNQTFPANPSRIYNITCLEGDFSVHRFLCGDGKNYTTSCQGKMEIIQSRCPVIRHEPTCNLVQGGILAEKNCKMLSFSNDTVTCSCNIIPRTGSRRFLSQTENNGTDNELSSGQVHVSYVSMMQAVAGNFESTVLSAGSLNDGVIERGWIALTIIGSLSGCIVLALILAYQADRKESSKDAESKMKDTTKGVLKNLKASMKVVDAYTLDKATSIVPRAQMKIKIEERQRNEKGQKKLLLTALDKFSKLTLELKEYRDLIENANEKAEFDGKELNRLAGSLTIPNRSSFI